MVSSTWGYVVHSIWRILYACTQRRILECKGAINLIKSEYLRILHDKTIIWNANLWNSPQSNKALGIQGDNTCTIVGISRQREIMLEMLATKKVHNIIEIQKIVPIYVAPKLDRLIKEEQTTQATTYI